jgi:hypothetical protein
MMNRIGMVLVLVCVGCKNSPSSSSGSADGSSEARSVPASSSTKAQAQRNKLPVDAPVLVCIRKVTGDNPFAAKGPFDCRASVKSFRAPFGEGSINGKQLVGAVRKYLGDTAFSEVRVHTVEDGHEPGRMMRMTGVNDDENEFFGDRVVTIPGGGFRIYLDVSVGS